MADETRQRILLLLQQGEMNEGDIVSHFDLTQPTISHHLTLLRNTNLVRTRHEGKYVFYRANPVCVTECCHLEQSSNLRLITFLPLPYTRDQLSSYLSTYA